MCNKFLLLIALFLFLVPAKVSNGSDNKNLTTQTTSSNRSEISPQKQQSHNDATGHTSLELPQDEASSHSHHSSEEDGKLHYLHFKRLDRRRWRAIYYFATNIILLIAHLCFLARNYIHATQ